MAGLSHNRGWPAALFVFVFGFGLLVTYWQGISGAATSPRWAFLIVAAAPVLAITRLRVTSLHVIGAVFVAWALSSYLWTAEPLDTVGALWKLIILACVFCIGAEYHDLKPFYFGAMWGMAVSSAICIAQVLGYAPVSDLAPDQAIGLFANRLILAETAALIGVALIAMGEWPLVAFVLPALILPCERAPILAFSFAGALSLWRSSKMAACALAVSGVLGAVSITAGVTFNGPLDQIDSQSRIETAAARLTIWRAVASTTSIAGYGFGSFRAVAPQPIEGAHVDHAHNEVLETTFEVGLIGAVLLGLFFVSALATAPLSIEGIVLAALLMEACFAFPLHEPVTAAFGALCAGGCAARLPCAGDAFADGRILLRRWLASRLGLLAFDRKSQRGRERVSIRSPLP